MAKIDADEKLSVAIHEQYGAAIKMLETVITKCPKEVWDDRTHGPPFWQVTYHTMFYLDGYLANSKKERELFRPKYEAERFEKLDNLPEATLNRDQILSYLFEIKVKAKQRFENLTVVELNQPAIYKWHGVSILSSLLYNLRHVMLHIGALNFRLLRKSVKLDNWVSQKLIKEK